MKLLSEGIVGETESIAYLQRYMCRPWREVHAELLSKGLPVRVDSGAWKTVLLVSGWDYVLKYPLNPGDIGAETAMEKESIAYEDLPPKLRKYTAHHWWSDRTCVAERLVCMADLAFERYQRLVYRTVVVARAFANHGLYDLHDTNFGLDGRGHIKLLDLGGHRL